MAHIAMVEEVDGKSADFAGKGQQRTIETD
jgi:hypothetical protein